MQLSSEQRRAAFSFWLRTGRWPRRVESGALELKFNPWHDPRNGRFTFGPGGPRSASGRRQDGPPAPFVEDRKSPSVTTPEQADAITDKLMAKYGNQPELREKIRNLNQYYKDKIAQLPGAAPVPAPPADPAKLAHFVGGVGEGLYASGKDAVTGVYKLVTTNPVTTARNVGIGLASTIDTVLAAEDTPTYVHLSRAASAVTNASAHDWGYAIGRAGGDLAIAAVPSAVAARVSSLARAGVADAKLVSKVPPKVLWVDEANTFRKVAKSRAGRRSLAKVYNDSAPGARSNPVTKKRQAPALEHITSDGNKRLVRFDGVDHDSIYGDVMIDRKWRIAMTEKSRKQALRQSEALSQNGITGVWEVPFETERRRAIRLLRKIGVTNIKVRRAKL